MFLTAMCVASTPGSKPSSFSTAARTSLVLLTGSLLILPHPFAGPAAPQPGDAILSSPRGARPPAAAPTFSSRPAGRQGRRAPAAGGRVVPCFRLLWALAVLEVR